jgi:hypothetical protein
MPNIYASRDIKSISEFYGQSSAVAGKTSHVSSMDKATNEAI